MKLAYIATLLFIISWVFFRDQELYREDDFFEQLTTILFLCTSIIFTLKLFRAGKLNRRYLFFGAVFFFIITMEEISWGQRVINWETPDLWKVINYQDETNFHNLFNPVLQYFYMAGTLFLGYIFYSIGTLKSIFSRFTWMGNISHLLPSIEYSLFSFVFFFLSLQHSAPYGGELIEGVFSLFGVIYATDIYLKD
ncbi:MAG: hypothetical protein GY755_17150 [Chloroflexi bacterium]|nr:hypothetical protein [Chloroflexota bacterium]